MYIIAGLGNPGLKYRKTRHNVGFAVIDRIADQYDINVDTMKSRAKTGTGYIEGQKVLLVKPQTYMNLSGESIRPLVDYFKVDPADQLIVIYDDISLNVGQLRIRKKGSAGGHNGMKSIIQHLGSNEFYRIKTGIGDKPQDMLLADYVLSRFTKEERDQIERAQDQCVKAVSTILTAGVEAAMNEYNRVVTR